MLVEELLFTKFVSVLKSVEGKFSMNMSRHFTAEFYNHLKNYTFDISILSYEHHNKLVINSKMSTPRTTHTGKADELNVFFQCHDFS